MRLSMQIYQDKSLIMTNNFFTYDDLKDYEIILHCKDRT